jgi:hypothetical protein
MRGVILGMIALVPSLSAGQEPGRTAKEEYEALAAEFKAAMDGWQRGFNLEDDRNAPEVYKEARYGDWPGWAFASRFVRLAELHPREPAAMDALSQVVAELGNSVGENDILMAPHYERALELLVRDHLDDGRLKDLCKHVARRLSPPAETFLRTVVEKSRSREARGVACLGLARYLTTKAEVAAKPWFEDEERLKDPFARFVMSRHDPGFFRYVRDSRPRESNAEALRVYELALKDYADVIYWQDPNDPGRRRSIGETVRPELTRLRAEVGEPAPEADGGRGDGRRGPGGRPPGS